ENPEQTMLMHALIENIVRDDLPAREQAAAFHKLKEMTALSWDRLAQQIGLEVARVKKLALLGEEENAPVLRALEGGRITQDRRSAWRGCVILRLRVSSFLWSPV